MTTSGGSSQHTAVLGDPEASPLDATRLEPGSIAVLPEADPFYVATVESAGGTVEPISTDTKGIIWLSYSRAVELPGILQRYPNVQWVQLPWAGVDAFAETLKSNSVGNKILWTSAKGAYSEPVAEHSLALILALLRAFPERVKATSWGRKFGRSLYRAEVVIVGAGGIAQELIRLLAPFQVKVTIVRRNQAEVLGADKTVSNRALLDVLPNADVVVVAAALTPDTKKMFGSSEFAAMKPSAVFVNVARGGLVDTDALVVALNSGQIAAAGIDVTDPEPLPDGHPLWTAKNVLITPHSADTPEMTRPLLAARITENVKAFINNSRFEGIVDPEAGY